MTLTLEHLKRAAIPTAGLGLIFVFSGIIWQGAVQLAVAVALIAIAASI